MIKIRLSRGGVINKPLYRVVVIDKTKKTKGKPIEVLGTWDPKHKKLEINREKLAEWIKKGAKPSSQMKQLID